jgi:hypothetical protein
MLDGQYSYLAFSVWIWLEMQTLMTWLFCLRSQMNQITTWSWRFYQDLLQMLINHFEEKFFESQLRFTIKFNISSQNVLAWIDIQYSKGASIQYEIQGFHQSFDTCFILKCSILKIKIKWIIKLNKVINNLNYCQEDCEGLQ